MSGGVGQLVLNGPLILAVPVAAAAGAITFISPCCLPLIPGYLSYVTGMSGADADDPGPGSSPAPADAGAASRAPRQAAATTATVTATQTATPAGPTAGARTAPGRRWTLAGTALFVAGFSALFASYGAAFGGLGEMLLSHQRGLVHATPLGRS